MIADITGKRYGEKMKKIEKDCEGEGRRKRRNKKNVPTSLCMSKKLIGLMSCSSTTNTDLSEIQINEAKLIKRLTGRKIL